jgi:hypothetical protein
MVSKLGSGYYGVESTGRTVTPQVRELMNKAFYEAASIPDDAISIVGDRDDEDSSGSRSRAMALLSR